MKHQSLINKEDVISAAACVEMLQPAGTDSTETQPVGKKWRRENSPLQHRIELRFSGRQAPNLVTILTEISD